MNAVMCQIRTLPVVMMAALIFYLSSLPGQDLPPLFPHADKVIHMGLYAFFCAAALYAMPPHLKRGRRYALALALTLVYALSDEWHQSFVPGRHMDGWDLVADGCGALLFQTLMWFRPRRS